MKWLQRLKCDHDWKYRKTINYIWDDGWPVHKVVEVYMCQKCLKTKKVRLM